MAKPKPLDSVDDRIKPQQTLSAPATWTGIVKVQRQLSPPRDGSALISNRLGTVYCVGPMTPDLLGMFTDEDDLKFYAYAELRGTLITIRRRVSDKDW